MDLDALFNTSVTTASKFPQKLSDAPGVVSIVTQDELRRFGGVTLLSVLQRVTGLNLSTSSFGDSSLIAIRGDQSRANAGHILILINGRPIRETLQGGLNGAVLESFPIGILERIEVVKGPGSVLYGSDAFSGVINLITKAAHGEDSGVSVSRGAAGETALAEHILFQRGALNVVQGGQYHLWPDWTVTNRDISQFGPVTNAAVLRNNSTGEYLGVNYKGLSFMSSYLAQETPSFLNGIVGDTRIKRGFGDLGYTLQATYRWKMTFNATYSRSVLDAPDFPFVHEDSHEGDLEWTNFITLSPSDQLTFGTVYTHIAGRETSLGDPPGAVIALGSRNSMGTYVQYEHQLTAEVKLIGGVQVNKIGAIPANAVPRGGVIWNPFSRLALKFLYGGAYRAPSLAENLLNDPNLHGNPNLKPERIGTADVQLIYTSPRFQASLDYFRSRMTDLIGVGSPAFPASFTNNSATVNFHGGEAEAKYYLKHDWFLTGSIFYQANDGAAELKSAFPAPNLVAKAGVSYLSPGGDAVSVFDAYQNNIAGFASTLNPPTKAFHSISAHARYDLSKRWFKDDILGAALFLNADDLSNTRVWLPALWTPSPNTIPVIRGRTVLFGIEFWRKKN